MRQISRAEYEQRFGRAGMRDPEYQAAVDNYLAALDFDDAYARFATQGLSHDDAVRAAQRMVHGRVRSDHPGPQGPQNVAAVEDFKRRQAAQRAAAGSGGGNVPPVVPPAGAAAVGGGGGRMPRFAGARIAKALAASLVGAGTLSGMVLQGWNNDPG